jgi:hypothetical protein
MQHCPWEANNRQPIKKFLTLCGIQISLLRSEDPTTLPILRAIEPAQCPLPQQITYHIPIFKHIAYAFLPNWPNSDKAVQQHSLRDGGLRDSRGSGSHTYVRAVPDVLYCLSFPADLPRIPHRAFQYNVMKSSAFHEHLPSRRSNLHKSVNELLLFFSTFILRFRHILQKIYPQSSTEQLLAFNETGTVLIT